MKKTLLIVVDAISWPVATEAMAEDKLPTLQALAQAGTLQPCLSVFPSITPAATSSIVTGCYPRDHGVLGAYWYDPVENEVVYYSDDFLVILNQGVDSFFDDLLIKLNHQRLQADTLYQVVERAGYQAACLNYLIYRGDTPHEANVPLPVSLIPGVPTVQTIKGPSILYLGDLVTTRVEALSHKLNRQGGLLNRFGFKDNNTADLLAQLVQEQALPELTVAYFPDNDIRSHKVGPKKATPTLQHMDTRLGQIIEFYGGLEKMLNELCIILMGDHSQSDVLADEAEAGIRLEPLLTDFAIAEAGKSWGPNDQLVVCPDMRTTQIYFKQPTPEQVERATEQLLVEPRIDQLIWATHSGTANCGDDGFYVATADRGRLRFCRGDDGPQAARDRYGNHWSWEGELSPVDGQLSEEGLLTFGRYPNAFERIAGGFECEYSGQLWATAQPGYEFRLSETSIHTGGGAHGSLHRQDSTTLLLVAGAPPGVEIPAHPRLTDISPLCQAILGLGQAASEAE